MADPSSIVHVVDDDASFRTAIADLLSACNYRVALYQSAEQLLEVLPSGPDAYCSICGCRAWAERSCKAGLLNWEIDCPSYSLSATATFRQSYRS